MRLPGLTLASLLFITSTLAAQQPPAGSPIIPPPGSGTNPGVAQPANLAPVFDPKNNRLDALLLQWEQRMKGVESVYVPELTRTETEKAGGQPRVYKGEARYLAPNYAALRMIREDDPSYWELLISTGTFAYVYRPKAKKLYVYDIPKQQAGQFKSNLLSVVFGTNATGAKQRYDLTLTKENKEFIYIKILPRFDADKVEFSEAQLVLQASTMLPRRLWFKRPNENTETWDIPKMDTTVKLTPADFTPPKLPDGWEMKRVQDQQAPAGTPRPTSNPARIIRPKGQ